MIIQFTLSLLICPKIDRIQRFFSVKIFFSESSFFSDCLLIHKKPRAREVKTIFPRKEIECECGVCMRVKERECVCMRVKERGRERKCMCVCVCECVEMVS